MRSEGTSTMRCLSTSWRRRTSLSASSRRPPSAGCCGLRAVRSTETDSSPRTSQAGHLRFRVFQGLENMTDAGLAHSHFQVNSFEQRAAQTAKRLFRLLPVFYGNRFLCARLCINFTNELLQQYFNNFIFENETALYREEGVSCARSSNCNSCESLFARKSGSTPLGSRLRPWQAEDFPDNAGIVRLLQQAPQAVPTLVGRIPGREIAFGCAVGTRCTQTMQGSSALTSAFTCTCTRGGNGTAGRIRSALHCFTFITC